jgi:hypothetical protein
VVKEEEEENRAKRLSDVFLFFPFSFRPLFYDAAAEKIS